MKQGRTLQDLARELQRQRDSQRDFRLPAKKLTLRPDRSVEFSLNGHGASAPVVEKFQPTELFMDQLTGWTNIPRKYADRLSTEAPELLATNVNHWLHRDERLRLVRTMDGNARAFLSARYRTIDNVGVVGAILPVFQRRGVTTASCDVTERHLWLKGVQMEKTFEIRKGDAIRTGVCVSNSEVGASAVKANLFIDRLICDNGAVIEESGIRKFHIGRQTAELEDAVEVFSDDTREADDKAFFLKLRDVVNACFDETAVTDVLKAVSEGTTRRITEKSKLEDVVEVVATRHGLNDTETEGVLRSLIDGGDLTQWGLANAVTDFSKKATSYERATELEKVGGSLMVLTESEWKEVSH